MCPEKERLMREARLQVASFELSGYDSSMDQRKAVKQYSRSAADAETPLPHDLRPENSLKTTMTYLLHKIMNLCDDDNTSIGDWFHFVWDRTRGIRKDITQQDLCSLVTVELAEQCVRFHIHCAARLIAEDPSTFDQKINTENLTKCLQSLKYMYNDLKLKNVKCPNEAEFRAYVVLLNLNESGNFLWEIKQLEKSILNSKEVRFSLDVYFAIANNNYVKFFNLTRDASYLNACLLLRYFTQIRMKAISIIMRSYTPRKVGFNYSISNLTDILAFEDFESTVNFLAHHGLMCDVDADIVYLDRSMFSSGETPYQMDRAFNLVESKMHSSVAQSVCGGPLPSPDCFNLLVPHSSFDNDGFLKRDSFYAEDQNGPTPNISKEGVFKVPKDSPPISPNFQSRTQKKDQLDGGNVFNKSPALNPFATPRTSTSPSRNIFKVNSHAEAKPMNPFASKMIFGSQQSQTATQSIFGSPGTSNLTAISSAKLPVPKIDPAPGFSFASASIIDKQKPASSIFGGPVEFGSPSSFSKPIEPSRSAFGFPFASSSPQAHDGEQKRREQEAAERIKQEEEKRLKQIAEDEKRLNQQLLLKEQLERDRLEIERITNEEEEKRLEKIAEDERTMTEACEEILNALIGEAVGDKVKQESEQSIKLFVKLPEDFYDAVEFDVVTDQVYKIYHQEFLAYVNRTKLKYEMMHKCFALWRKTTTEEIRRRDKLSTIGCSILNSSLEQQAEGLHHPEQKAALSNMKQYLSGSPQFIELPDFRQYAKINLFEDLTVKPIESSTNIFWKLLVSIPHKNEEKCLGFASFINKWLLKTFGEAADDNGIFFVDEKMMKNSRGKLAICVRKVQGVELLDEKGKKSADLVQHSNGIIFLTTSTNLAASRRRLQNILDKLELPVPVSLIVYKNQVQATDEAELIQFMDLSMEVKVSSFEINLFYECHEKDKNLTQVVIDSCQWTNDCHVDQLLEKNLKLFDLQMQHMLDFFQITIGDEMWQRLELSCRQSKDFRIHMNSFNNSILMYNKCIDKLMQMVTNDYRKMPSLPDEFRKRLTAIDLKIPSSYEYFPDDWKSNDRQRQQIGFIHELKLVLMPDDSFKSFDDFRSKLMTFLTGNMSTHNEKVFQAVVAKVIDLLYRQNMISDDDITEALSKFCWLNILGEIVVGKFNEVYQKNPEVPSKIIYHKKDLQRYKGVPWWFTIEFRSEHEEPKRKKPKLVQPTAAEIELLLTKSITSLGKLNNKISSFKEVSNKTREASKDFDQHLFDFEENFRGKLLDWEEKFKD